MKLEPEAVKAILLTIEENMLSDDVMSKQQILKLVPQSDYYIEEDLNQAFNVLLTSNYLNVVPNSEARDNRKVLITVKISGLTWDGCQFLDNIRDKKRWEAVKERAKAVGGCALDILSSVASGLAVEAISNPGALNSFIENTKKLFIK